jgi:3-methyladenine DNA glycosylase/8-oxoguanine DNA glycosylase
VIKGSIYTNTVINLDFTFRSGQIFRWNKINGYWIGITHDTAVALIQKGNVLKFKFEGKMKYEDLVEFLSLNEDFSEIFKKFSSNDIASKLFKKYRGLRILKQDPWECTISYLSASMNNIKRINRMLNVLSSFSKTTLSIGNLKLKGFPKYEDLMNLKEEDFKKLGFGFRSSYYVDLINKVKEDFEIGSLKKLDTNNLREKLMEIKGIGKKTADCIALYSFHRLECFPQDRWIKRAIIKYYRKPLEGFIGIKIDKKTMDKNYDNIAQFFNEKYLGIAGYIQLLLYVHTRKI